MIRPKKKGSTAKGDGYRPVRIGSQIHCVLCAPCGCTHTAASVSSGQSGRGAPSTQPKKAPPISPSLSPSLCGIASGAIRTGERQSVAVRWSDKDQSHPVRSPPPHTHSSGQHAHTRDTTTRIGFFLVSISSFCVVKVFPASVPHFEPDSVSGLCASQSRLLLVRPEC